MKIGNQNPTFSVVGEYYDSIGDLVADMFEEDAGANFYDCQRYEMKLMLAVKEDGSPASLSIGIAKPRQNGKSFSARNYAIYKSDFQGKNVLYSAHHSSTTHKMFLEIASIFDCPERYPEFAKDIKTIVRGRGIEGLYFKDWKDEDGIYHEGGKIEFQTRTNSGARGGTFSVIIIDEAQELTEDQLAAMLPTISAASELTDPSALPQIIYLGTPPDDTCNGTVFRRIRDNAHENPENRMNWWLEWSITSIDDINQDNVLDLCYETNPAMGRRISEEVVLNEFNTMSIDKFARERLGWWSPVIEEKIDYAIDHDKWKMCKSDLLKPEGKTAYGVKFSADGSIVSLCGAVIPKEGVPRISLINQQTTNNGIRWLVDWLNERYKKASCVVIDGKNGVDVLIDRITDTWKLKNSIIRASTKTVIAAASMLTDAINEESVTWYSGQELLNDSAMTSVKRSIAGGWGFGGENSTPIEAAALAFYGVKTTKRDPSKKMRAG